MSGPRPPRARLRALIGTVCTAVLGAGLLAGAGAATAAAPPPRGAAATGAAPGTRRHTFLWELSGDTRTAS
ncbi:hypothetical protein [Streptomyces sp. NPDC096153]|uniref:hypothetical protein n=1 Tax=Streptomyces sp. NPDC096153 TaxID=3155548 RepID=UPI003329E11D